MAKRKPKRDIYQEVTDRVLQLLERGTVPWRNPIRRQGGSGWPMNLTSKKQYRGINVFLLAATSSERGFGSDYWLTFRQALKLGGQVKKGEKSSLVTFWKLYETEDPKTGDEVTIPVLRHYNVFNADQCDGIEPPDRVPFEPLVACEAIVQGYQTIPPIEHHPTKACYLPTQDKVLIPEPEGFDSREDYYCTLFHELVHSTGSKSRLDRGFEEEPAPFGSPSYSKEELVAEMGAAFLAATSGISAATIEQSAAYIDGWKRSLRGDSKLVVSAGSAAQKAADYILGETFEEAAAKPEPTPKPPPPPPSSQLDLF